VFNCGSELALRFRSGLLLAGSQDASSLRLCSLPRRLSTLVGAEINLNGPAITRSVGKDQGHRGAGCPGLHRGDQGVAAFDDLVFDLGHHLAGSEPGRRGGATGCHVDDPGTPA